MESHGINIRTLRAGQLESELKEIYSVARVAFRNNPFYVPVTEAEFLAMYHPLRQSVPTDLILIARDEETAVGFCFAVPDLLQSNQGVPIDTIIVKTFGVLPGRKYAGLGQILLEDIHQRAISGGYRHAIHALVREQAAMCKIADRYGTTFRRYALFGKEIS